MNYTKEQWMHLFEAAPDMYGALKKIMAASKYWESEVGHIIESAEALNSGVKALAKAEGKGV